MTARILVVDDVVANARLLEAKLTAEYYQVAAAQDGFEALNVATNWQPDVVLLDVMMPRMDGYEVCRRLKADPATHHIPVVMITALGDPPARLRGLECGADDFLTKPVEFGTLLARLRSLVRLKRVLDEWRARGETARALGLAHAHPREPAISGARALVVDDWAPGAQAIQDILGLEGILTGRARTEVEALALSTAIPFDLIVISLSMAVTDALRLASKLRAADATHDIPMLLVAEPEQRGQILRGFDLGANDWLLRPVDSNELRARARNQIRRKFYQDSLRADLGHALEMALIDPLTGLYNQRYVLRHLRNLLASQPGWVTVLMVDVDHFKVVNDQFGHTVGDEALKLIAETLRGQMRVFDTVARYGGEEFVVVMPATTLQDAATAAERLRAAVGGTVFHPRPQLRHGLTVSVGVASHCDADGEDDLAPTAEKLIQWADRALYDAKRAGRNRVETMKAV